MLAPRLQVVGLQETASSGILRALRRRAEALGGQRIEVGVRTGGGRGAEKNATILRRQIGWDRNPAYLSKPWRAEIMRLVRNAIRHPTSAAWGFMEVAHRMVDAMRDNVRRQENKTGRRFRPLTPGYAAWKRRQVGDKPILRLTDDLVDGLQPFVIRRE